jgi:hypothetical protein
MDTSVEIDAFSQQPSRTNKINIDLSPTEEFLSQTTAAKKAHRDSVYEAKSHSRKVFKRIRLIAFGCIGAGLAGAGYYFNREYDKSYEIYSADKNTSLQVNPDQSLSVQSLDQKWADVEKNKKNRNLFYIFAGVSAGLFTVSIFF